MAGGGTIGSFARGFMDLLGLQTTGNMPSDLSGVVVPVVDQLEMFLAPRQVTLGQQVTTPTVGFNTFSLFVIPANEVWVLKALTAFGTAEAGVTFEISPAMRFGGSVAPTLARPQAVAAGLQSSNGIAPPPLWLPSGTELGVRVDNVTGVPTAASTLNLNALFARMRAGG